MKKAKSSTKSRVKHSSSSLTRHKTTSSSLSSLSAISVPSRQVHNPSSVRQEKRRAQKFTDLRRKLLTDTYTPPKTHKERVSSRLYASVDLGSPKFNVCLYIISYSIVYFIFIPISHWYRLMSLCRLYFSFHRLMGFKLHHLSHYRHGYLI